MFNLRQTPAGFLAATMAGAALFAAVPAGAQDAHGVIAFGETDEGKGVAYGFSWNLPGKEAAHAEAVNACISAGGTHCVQLAWFQAGCGALAVDQYGNAQGKPGMSLEQAEARALRTCEAVGGVSCNIVGSACAATGGAPGTWSGERKRPAGARFANVSPRTGRRAAHPRRAHPGPAEPDRSGVRCRPRRWRFRAAHSLRHPTMAERKSPGSNGPCHARTSRIPYGCRCFLRRASTGTPTGNGCCLGLRRLHGTLHERKGLRPLPPHLLERNGSKAVRHCAGCRARHGSQAAPPPFRLPRKEIARLSTRKWMPSRGLSRKIMVILIILVCGFSPKMMKGSLKYSLILRRKTAWEKYRSTMIAR